MFAAAMGTGFAARPLHARANKKQKPFVCKFAPNIREGRKNLFPHSTKNMSEVDKLSFFYDMGFRAFEDNYMSDRPIELQKALGKRLEKLGMEMGTFTSYNGMKDTFMTANRENFKASTDKKSAIERTKKIMSEMMEVGKRVGAQYTTVVPGLHDDSINRGYQFENVVEHLKVATEICEKAGIVMILEPLSRTRHPHLWLQRADEAFQLCKRVGSANCKFLFDVFHQQNTEGSLFRNIDASWGEIAYFHLADVPMRTEPLSGEINFKNLIAHIHSKGFRGIYGMEHEISSNSPDCEEKLLKAYREIDAS